VNRSILLVYLASFGAFASFYLLLGVVPLFAREQGHGDFGGAISTAVFMLATVLAELLTTRVMRAIGTKYALAIGVALMTLPVFALLLDTSLALILIVSAVRGVGFAFVVVASSTMVVDLAPEGKRGESIGLYGVIVSVPSIVFLPFGVWLVDQVGFGVLFAVAGSCAVFAIITAVVRIPVPVAQELTGMLHALRTRRVLPLAIMFTVTALASGLLITYLPLDFDPTTAAIGLFVMGVATTVSRWLSGRFGDRRDATLLLIPALVLGVLGLLLVLFVPPLMIAGAVLFGVAFGALQNASIHLMFDATGPSGFGAVSAIWNIAFDLGLGLGAFAFGVLAADYSLVVAAALLALSIALIAFSTRSGSSKSSQVTPG
jgi:predicted MFS family arabinose efflux permease